MIHSSDLEIGIHGSETGDFAVDIRYRGADGLDQPPARGHWEIDLGALDWAGPSYGRVLTEQVFRDRILVDYFKEAFISTERDAGGGPLRIRLFLGAGAARLHGLKWELLEAPWEDPSRPLATRQRIVFSRYLSSFDWRPVQLRARDSLRALIVVANPTDLAAFKMAVMDVDGEVARARDHLASIPSEVVRGPDTLGQLDIQLLRDEYDILYIVCHGALRNGEPRLWLEGPDGGSAITAGGEVVTRLAESTRRPRLVVLASCQSAGDGDDASAGEEGALAAIGPRLAEAGLPAVLAMQARISLETVRGFMPAFFERLSRHGVVDLAASEARGLVRDRPDFWVPVIFSRIGNGCIWYQPGFAQGQGEGFDGWNALLQSIRQGKCTPILGSSLLEGLVGSPREIARRWAEDVNFAMSPHDREDLPQVTQYLAVMESLSYPAVALEDRLRIEVARRFRDLPDGGPLDALLEEARHRRCQVNAAEPHAVLASMPLPIFITTNADDQLRKALVEAGKQPQVELLRWHRRPDYDWPPSAFDDQADYVPTPTRPLVFHLYGQLREPDSLVVTEDDYFDFLIGATRNKDLVPIVVKEALSRTALLFLGFRMEEWDFRVLFRSILAQGNKNQLNVKFKHIAAQIDPEEGRHINPEKARRYLQNYFRNASISIYWGSMDDFVCELRTRAAALATGSPSEDRR